MQQPAVEPINAPKIHQCVVNNNIAELRSAIEQVPFIDVKDANGLSALHHACMLGFTDCCELLLTKGANPVLKTPANETALHLAVKNGHVATVNVLLNSSVQATVDLLDKVDMNGRSVLHLAAINGSEVIVSCLLKHNADVNATNEHGFTPLHFAARSGHLSIVKLLISNKALMHLKTIDDETAQLVAERYRHFNIAAYLKAVLGFNDNLEVNFDAYHQLMLVELYYQHQQSDKAKAICQELINTDSKNGIYYYNLAQLQQAAEEWDIAQLTYETALKLTTMPQLNCAYASLLYQQGDYNNALSQSLQALNSSQAQTTIVWSPLLQTVFSPIFKAAIDKHDTPIRISALAFYLSFVSYRALGQLDNAQQQLLAFTQVFAANNMLVEAEIIGYCFITCGNYAEAAYYYEQALRQCPHTKNIQINLLTCIAHYSEVKMTDKPLLSWDYVQQDMLVKQVYQQHQADKVIEHSQLARTAAQLQAIPAQIQCLIRIADAHSWLNQFDMAAKYYVAAHKLYKQHQQQIVLSDDELVKKDPRELFYTAQTAMDCDAQLQQQLQQLELLYLQQNLSKPKQLAKVAESQKELWFYRHHLAALRATVQKELAAQQRDPCM